MANYAEYIGISNAQITFDKVPNNQSVPFYFLLAFAADYDKDNKFTDGRFQTQWATDFDATTISSYKRSHSKTKFILSIGWFGEAKFPFSATDDWVPNAVKSIGELINDNSFDGIDIHYSSYDKSLGPKAFASKVGDLITQLKHNGIVDIVFITPTPYMEDYYQKLYNGYKDQIDYVNYPFYESGIPLNTVTAFKSAIEGVQKNYGSAKLLVGNVTNDNNKGKIPDEVFFKTYKQISLQLHGIFGWCADNSPETFQFENDAQNVLKD